MSAFARPRDEPGKDAMTEPGLHVLAMWRVQPGALMLLGLTRGLIPASGAAQIQLDPASRGAFRSLSWPIAQTEKPGGHGFLMAIRLPDRTDPRDGAGLLLHGAGGERLTLRLPSASLELVNDPAFGQQVARLAGPHSAAVARFMLDTLRPRADRDVPRVGTMLRAFLSQAAHPDGTIEIMAAVPDGCVLLQGWGARVTGPIQVVLAGAALPCFAGHAGEFTRTDTPAPATGVVLALPPAAAGALAGIDRVFIVSDHGLHSRTLVEHRLLDPAASAGHIRDMLPALRGPAAMQELLREALRPRYEGRDTLCNNAHPVRAAIDFAAAAPGVGAYLSGWVFDPVRLVAELHLCGTHGLATRIDLAWTRSQRQDVADAFRVTPGFPPPSDAEGGLRSDSAPNGFAVSTVAAPAAGEALFLRVTFTDGNRAFVPVPAGDPAEPAVRARLLASVDLFKPSGATILERQVAPLMSRLRPTAQPPARMLIQGPTTREHAVVVPLAAPGMPRVFLSGFLQDPPGPAEQLVLVCGPEWDQAALDRLCSLVRFYGLPASVLASADTAGPVAALREAARSTDAAVFLLAGPGACGRALGWRKALCRAVSGRDGAAFACPTLLYEDWSIRYAGAAELGFQDIAPLTQPQALVAGMPAGMIPGMAAGQAPVPAVMGTLECCAVRRTALVALDGAGVLSTDAGREADFFLRLHAAGLAGVWVPSIQVYASEDGADAGQAGRMVDGWVLRETWRGARQQTAGRE